MTAPFFEYGLLSDSAALLLALPIGFAFGWFLERGGLGNARKLSAQFYFTDLTVFKVMFSAIVTAALGVFWLARIGWLDVSLIAVPPTFILPQLLGGVIFGVGFVLGGLCPGTSCVATASGRADGLALLAGLLVGVFLFGELLPAIDGFYQSTGRAALTLPDVLPLREGTIVFLLVAVALLGFLLAETVERRTSKEA